MNPNYVELMRMELSSKLKVICSNRDKAISIYEALHPDNVDMPREMYIDEEIVVDKDKHVYQVLITIEKADARRFDTLKGTLDEILSILELVESLFTTLK